MPLLLSVLYGFIQRMKNGLIVGGILIVVVAAGAWYLSSSPTQTGQEAAVSAVSSTPIFSAMVTPIATQVFAQATDAGAQYAELATTTPVGEGTRVKTSEKGRALIEGSHEAFLDYDTEIVIASADAGKGTHINLEGGKIWARVKNVVDSGDTYEVETPNAVAVVRGTSFGLYYKDGDTTLLVTEGEVRMSAVDPETGEVVPDTEVIVTDGEKAVREEDKPIAEDVIADKDKVEEWFDFGASEGDADESESGEAVSDTEPVSDAAPSPEPVAEEPPQNPPPAEPVQNPPAEQNPPLAPRPVPPSGERLALSKLAPADGAESANLPNIPIDIYGSGLDTVIGVAVDTHVVRDFTIVDHMHIRFFLPKGFAPGIYTVGVTDKAGKKAFLYDALDIYDKRAPVQDGG